jgi:hypothetical protein
VTLPFGKLSISGTVFNDGNGDADVNGTTIYNPSSTVLFVTLVDATGTAIATKAVATDGTYSFNDAEGVTPNATFTVVLSTSANATTASLPANWNNTGENLNDSGAGNDGAKDGVITVVIGTSSIPKIDLGINHKPTADDKSEPTQINPGGTNQAAVPTLVGADDESTTLIYTITTLPTNATLYYDGAAITTPNFVVADPSLLTVDPDDGDQTVVFNYTTTDEDGVVSDPATVTMPFTGLEISGTVFNDENSDVNVDGTTINTPNGIQLHATLVDATGTVVATAAIAADGTYKFTDADGVRANTTYTVVLSTTASGTAPVLPANWDNTGENINSAAAGNDGTEDGVITVVVAEAKIPLVDFGIAQLGNWVGTVTEDTTHDGNGDTPIANVTIKLYTDPNGDGKSDDGVLVGTTTTDATGNYSFNGLLFGDYVAIETQPNDLTNVSENEGGADNDKPNNGVVNAIAGHVSAGETDSGNNFVEEAVGTLTGNVSHENNTGLNPLSGVTVVIFDNTGTEVARTTTDESGNYTFENLIPGAYIVRELQPDGYIDVRENEGGADNDSVVSTGFNEISANVEVGEVDTANDFVEAIASARTATPTPTPTPTPKPGGSVTDKDYEDATVVTDILADMPHTGTVNNRTGDIIKFVAPKSGLYTFFTNVDSYTKGQLLDRNHYVLENSENAALANFTMSHALKAGETYYVRVTSNYGGNFTLNSDFRSIDDFVERFYVDLLNRPAEAAGLKYWVDLLAAGVTSGSDVAYGFVESAEFKSRNLNDNDFLTVLYKTFFNRAPDAGGLAYWAEKLQSGMTRTEVLNGFTGSAEFKARCEAYGIELTTSNVGKFVTRLYATGLERMPDGAGLRFWTHSLEDGDISVSKLMYGIVFSDEFINRNLDNTQYLQTLYRMMFNREADAGGLAAWLERLDSGKKDRKEVLDGFLLSPEFAALANAYGIKI